MENAWYPVAPMRTARRNCGVGVLNGQLYAVGGRNESKQVRARGVGAPVFAGWRYERGVPGGRNESKQVRGVNGFGEFGLQEYLARKKPSPPWTLR